MVQGNIVRQPKKTIDRETLQQMAAQQEKAIDATTEELYSAQAIPKALDFSWCISTSSSPEPVDPSVWPCSILRPCDSS